MVFEDFRLFLRSLSYIGSSGRLVERISNKFRLDPRQPLPIRSKDITLLTGGGKPTFSLKIWNCHWKGGGHLLGKNYKNTVHSLHYSLYKKHIKTFCFASDRRASACREPKFLCRKLIKTYKNL